MVQTPVLDDDRTKSVAFQIPTVFDTAGTSLKWLEDGYNAMWSSEQIFSDELSSYLKNPPSFNVKSVDIPESVDSDTATITIDVENTGSSPGGFRTIVRGDNTRYIDRPVESGQTKQIAVEVTVSGNSQPTAVSWDTDQRSGTIETSN